MEPSFPPDLLEEMAAENVVAFVGSGPSIAAGLPSWPDLLQELAIHVRRSEEVRDALEGGHFLDVAHYLAREVGEASLQLKAAQILRRVEEPGSIHHRVVALPFKGIVTTNYDMLLTAADVNRRYGSPLTHRNRLLGPHLRRRFLFHLHGHIDDPSSIVLTKQSYDRFALGESVEAVAFLRGVFQSSIVIFIGFGFRDANIDELLRGMQREGITTGWNVFALIADREQSDPVLSSALRCRNVSPIFVDASTDHGVGALCDWLSALGKIVKSVLRAKLEPALKVLSDRAVGRLQTILEESDYRQFLRQALEEIEDRPDLTFLTAAGRVDTSELLARITRGELRTILVKLNSSKPDRRLMEALALVPPVA